MVETAALRQADVVKTRAAGGLARPAQPADRDLGGGGGDRAAGVSAAEREELAAVDPGETRQLSRLVENLLDLSKLEAGAAKPRREWLSIEEVLGAALEDWRRRARREDLRRRDQSRSIAICRGCAPTRRSWSGRS